MKMNSMKRMNMKASASASASGTATGSGSGTQSVNSSSSIGGGSSSNRSSSVSKTPKNMKTSKRVHIGRFIFILALIGVAAGLGYGAYKLIKEGETNTAQERFDSVAERALQIAQTTLEEKKLVSDALAYVAASENPYATKNWPNVYMEGYEEIATTLSKVTERQSLSFCPIVIPGTQQQIEFEKFAYDLFEQRNLPDNSGVSMFGRGIFSYDFSPEAEYDDKRKHDTSNYTYYGSERNILLPFLQSNLGYHSALMLNVHFEKERGLRIDQALDCSDERKLTKDYSKECGTISDLFWTPTNQDGIDPGPGLIIFSPIYPKYDNTTITGFIVAKTIMHDMLQYGFANDVNGLHAVVSISTGKSFTYEIQGGQAYFIGNGDLHDDSTALYHAQQHINPNYFSDTAPLYYIDLYSTSDFVDEYSTDNPKIACIGAVMIIVFTSLLFLFYDFFVRKEFSDKKSLLESKRQFVRFVSHEVRTPLNTVCMGLTLMQDDFSKCLGLRHHHHGGGGGGGGIAPQQQPSPSSQKATQDQDQVPQVPQANNQANQANQAPDMEQIEDWMQLSAQIQSNAEAAVSVLNDLLNYDKIQMGNLTLELSLIPVWSIIQKTVAEFSIASLEKHVTLAIDFTPLLDEEEQENATAATEVAAEEDGGGLGLGLGLIDNMGRTVLKQLSPEKKSYKIVADNIRIAQVLRNLISNGLKFSSENGALTVRVSHQLPKKFKKFKKKMKDDAYETIELSDGETAQLAKQGNIVIDVVDDGVGMTPEQVRTVFNDGTQFNANKLQAGGGSGLGLNIAKGIANEHGGSLKCHSAGIGKGTTFTLTIPVYKMEHGPGRALSSDESTSKEDTMMSGCDNNNNNINSSSNNEVGSDYVAQEDFQIENLEILVVDDSATNRKLCMRLLEKQGHTCDGANDGKEAVDMAKAALERNEPYDCILLDYEMPNMIGPEACKRIREMGCWSYIVGVTGNVMGEDVARFRECGANWVLPKPFKLEALEQKWIEDGVSPRRKDPDDSGRFQLIPLDADTSERLKLNLKTLDTDSVSTGSGMKRIDSCGRVLKLT